MSNDHEFTDGEKTQAILSKYLLSKMITAEFQVQGFIPFNVSLEVKNMEYLNEDALGLDLIVQKEYAN